MVFENAVSQVLNQFLGDFVENLDGNQLNIGIWGGDVELKNLVLKPSALDDLDLPIQTVYGTIGKLVLKIPWKSLYTSPTVVLVENVYLLAQPNQQVKYDPLKEDKKLLAAKRKEIEKVETKKKAEQDKDKPKADPGFVQKLTQQIIKNIQLHITNIHIRYEDGVTNVGKPFALGVTLSKLNVESTDSNWKKAIVEDVSKIYKIVDLEGLGVYWNCSAKIYGKINQADMLHKLKQEIATKDTKPKGYTYILGPINASARLRMNPKPEDDQQPYTIPLNHLNLDMGKLFIGITKTQYRDIIALADSMDRMSKGTPYRKYRPDVDGYKGHYRQWWHFAYKCVLEGEVRRKKRNWQWEHMLQHRNMCKEYGKLYKKQLKKQTKENDNKRIEECEKKLDLVNIVIIRQRIEFETERLLKQQKSTHDKAGWLDWVWSSSSKVDNKEDTAKSIDILKQFEKEMTHEEKQRLYQAIDYHENTTPTVYPAAFVDNSLTFLLRTLEIELKDNDTVIKTNLKSVRLKVETRVSAAALKVHMQISDFVTTGLQQEEYLPEIITSEDAQKGKGLLEVMFETNPLDDSCDQRIRVTAQPLKIVYDAITINRVIDIFKIPQDTPLDQLSAAAGNGFTNVKEMTSTGLAYAIEKHVRLDINIDFQAPYVVIPYGGKLTENVNVFVINLGRLKLFSEENKFKEIDIQKMYAEGVPQSQIFSQLIEHSYDNFHLQLSNIQVLVAQGEEDWRSPIKNSETSNMHLLNPLSLSIKYSKCVIVDDPRLPLHKVSGKLPNVSLTVSEARLLLLVALATSIPMPVSDEPKPEPLRRSSVGSQPMIYRLQEQAKETKQRLATVPLPPDTNRKEYTQFTTLEASFVMAELCLILNQQENIEAKISQLVNLNIKGLEAGLKQKTFETNINLKLGSIGLTQTHLDNTIDIISTPISPTDDEYLFGVVFTQVDKTSPELHSTYGSCETSLTLNFTQLAIVLHQEGLLQLMKFASELQDNVDSITYNPTLSRTLSGRELARSMSQLSDILDEKRKQAISQRKTRKDPVVVETIKFKLKANMEEVSVKFCTEHFDISNIAIRGITSEIIVKETYTQIRAKLLELCVTDLYAATNHNLILHGTEGTALTAQVVLNNLEEKVESQKPDMVVTVTLGGSRIVFLNRFVTSMLNFTNQFQAAQQTLKEASEEAARRAKENMKDVYEKATKISLNINLKAPVIVVPVNSLSYNALLIDLGTIFLENKFMTLNIKNKDGFSAVVDDLDVNLSDLKISRIELSTKHEITNECIMLEPLNFTLNIKRNLSSSWYREIPDIYISGKIKLINLMLSQEDYKMIMSTLTENLGEGVAQEIKPPEVSAVPSRLDALESATVVQIEAKVAEDDADKTHVFLKFVFAMEQLIINLYIGGSKSLSADASFHSARDHLGRFSLEGLSVKGRILTDQSIVTSVLLVNCLLDDMRKGREDKLNRLIQRSLVEGETQLTSSKVEPRRSMIDVTFQQKKNDMFVDVRIYSFTIIFSVEYLMKIADFFSNLDENKRDTVASKSTTSLKSTSTGKSSRHNASVMQTTGDKETQMTLNLRLEKPDIVLVEHMDNINTNAMILNSEVTVKFRMNGAHQVMSGIVKDLQLYTCNYNPAFRAETRGNVLHPVTVSLAGSTPEGKGLHLELIVTDVLLNVSPATIELLNRVLVTMSSNQAKTEEEEEDSFNHNTLWDQKSLKDEDHWYLKMDTALEATEEVDSGLSLEKAPLQELCIITVPSIVVTVEAGVGNKTLPMLMLEVSLKGSAKNWSSQLGVDGALTLQMGYYNSRQALWEPLIEPVDNKPWELKLELTMNDQEDNPNATSPTSEDMTELTAQQPVISIDINSDKNLEMTVTKTCLEVLQNLGKAFGEAIKSESMTKASHVVSPFKVLNEIGEDVTLLLEQSSFDRVEGESIADINKNAAVHLQLKPELAKDDKLRLSTVMMKTQVKDRFLTIRVNKYNCELSLPVVRADKRFFMLNYRGDSNDNYGIISDVKVEEGVTVITLRSIIQVHNHFAQNVEVYYMTSCGNELELIGTIEPNGSLNVPLKAVYSLTGELFFAVRDYSITCSPFVWKDLLTNLSVAKILQCPMKDESLGIRPFMIKVIGEIEQVYYENTSRHTMASTCYNIHLRPAVILKNFLPVDIVVCIEESAVELDVKSGDMLHLPNIDPGKSVMVVRLPDYLEKEWSCRQETLLEPPEFSVWTFSSYDSPTKMSLCLGMHSLADNGSLVLSLYCPFWMLNKTGLMLGYRTDNENVNVLHHPADFKGPIMFSFNAKNFFGKKKTSIRIESGEWSDKFSIDVAGSSGVVSCKANNKKYQIGVHNQLTYNSLTKQVTFTPYYVIMNEAPFAIECQESDRPADHWINIEPKSCTALWPQSQFDDKLLKLRVVGTNEISASFLYTESHTTLLRLNNRYGGVNVDIQLTEGAVYINVAPYTDGCAPALIVNHTDDNLNFWEKESVQIRTLKPRHSTLYTWENPSGPRHLVWEKGHKKEIENDLRKDGCGSYFLDEEKEIYWTSFLDGMQRVLLFTDIRELAEGAQASKLFEVINQEISVSIQGVGLSLVNNWARQEILYIGIASSGIIWETCKLNGRRYKPLGPKESTHIENAYQNYLFKTASNRDEELSGREIVDNRMEVDFNTLQMFKPNKRKIRRTYQTGLWLQMKTSPSQMQLHAKINRLQIDNQMYDCTFPVLLAPVAPPKSVAVDSGIKPFVEVSIVQLLMKNSQIRQFKYFKVLVQEFHVKVDLGFINALIDLFTQGESSDEQEKQQFLTDLKLVDEALYSHAASQSIQEQKSFYDLLHFSPLKIHVSFSMTAGSSSNNSTPNFLNVVLQGVGVTLTDVQDVVFKLAYFERDYTFLTQRQLTSEATSHYVGQLVKQLYVLVLGLDVIGNPYGLVIGIGQGFEDLFYEPFQGAIQGPSEFAEGLALGVRSLFGHTVGGAVGAVSRITGAMGKGIAALTFDEDFQRKRRDQMNKKPASAQEGIARSGKGLVMGVLDGVTGVFTKPISGAREQGVEGFFKGLGKGAVGLVTRPAAGVVDFASGSLDVVKRATEVSEDTLRLRPPRFLQADGLVRPYSKQESEGHKLLMDLAKGKYSKTDVYVYHYVVMERKEILLLTDKRLAYVTHNDLFGGWQIEWSYTWQELPHPAKVVDKGVCLPTADVKKKKLFGSNDTAKIILVPDPKTKEDLCFKIESLRSA